MILDDASSHNPFSADPYFVERYLRSILCLPLINQGKLTGILYLENNLTPRVFTPDRVALLKVLASQAAVSLENSRLYRDVADREGKIRRLVDANIIGIIIADREGRILEANDAFLHILGYDREDVVSRCVRWTELSPPEWRERDILTQAELNSTGIVQPFEKEYIRKDGSRVPVLIGAALFKEGGDEGVAFVLDLTERRREACQARMAPAIDYRPTIFGRRELQTVIGKASSRQYWKIKGPDRGTFKGPHQKKIDVSDPLPDGNMGRRNQYHVFPRHAVWYHHNRR